MKARRARWWAAQRPAARSALITTLSCELALVGTMALHLPDPAWALISVFVLSTPLAGASVLKGLLRLVGTLLGAGLGIAMIDWFVDAPLGFSATLFVVTAIAIYGGTGGRYPYAFQIGLVSLVIVGVQSITQPQHAEAIAFARACEVGIGVLAAIALRLSLAPQRASDELRAELAAQVERIRHGLAVGLAPGMPERLLARVLSAPQQQGLLQNAHTEGDLSAVERRRLTRAVAIVAATADRTLAAMAVRGAHADLAADEPEALRDLRAALDARLSALAAALPRRRAAGAPPSYPPLPRVAAATLPGQGPAADYRGALSAALNRVADGADDLAALVGYLGPGSPPAPPGSPADVAGQPEVRRRWRPDRERVGHAIKVAVILQTTLWLWMVFHLPSGMQAMVSATLVSQRTIGATMLKGGQRLAGVLIGGALGILVAALAMPALSELWVFGLLIAPMLFACAWVNDSSKRYGYLGFQAGFAFLLTLVAGDAPQPAPMAPLMRAVGVVLGVGIAALLLRALAPVDAWAEALRHLAAVLEASVRALAGRAPVPAAELAALRDRSASFVAEWDPSARRRGWPAWPLREVFGLTSQLAAVAAAPRPDIADAGAAAELARAAEGLERAAARCATALRSRRPAADESELAAVRAALDGLSRVSADERVQARIGSWRTALSILEQLEHTLARHAVLPAGAAVATPAPAS